MYIKQHKKDVLSIRLSLMAWRCLVLLDELTDNLNGMILVLSGKF